MQAEEIKHRKERPLGRFVEGVAVLGGLATLGVAGFVFVDVVLRAVATPILGAREITSLALTLIVASGLASGAIHGTHLSINALAGLLGPRARVVQKIIAEVISLIILAAFAWRAYLGGIEAADFGDRTMLLSIPHGPFYFALAAGLALHALVALADLAARLRNLSQESADVD